MRKNWRFFCQKFIFGEQLLIFFYRFDTSRFDRSRLVSHLINTWWPATNVIEWQGMLHKCKIVQGCGWSGVMVFTISTQQPSTSVLTPSPSSQHCRHYHQHDSVHAFHHHYNPDPDPDHHHRPRLWKQGGHGCLCPAASTVHPLFTTKWFVTPCLQATLYKTRFMGCDVGEFRSCFWVILSCFH